MVLIRKLFVVFISALSLDVVAQVSETKSAAGTPAVSKKLTKKAPVVEAPVVEAPVDEVSVVEEAAIEAPVVPAKVKSGVAAASKSYVFVDLGYSKPLGPVRDYVKGGFQYGFEYLRASPRSKSPRMMWRAGLIYVRSSHSGKLSGGSRAKSLRKDILLVVGATTSGIGVRFFCDGLLGLSSRRLYIQSGSQSVGDDYYSRSKLGIGIRGGVQYPLSRGANPVIARVGLGLLTGPAMTSGHLHYNQKRVNIGGLEVNVGMNLGWQF